MESANLKTYGSAAMVAPPLLYNDPTRARWRQFISGAGDEGGACQKFLSSLDTLCPSSYYVSGIDDYLAALWYALAMVVGEKSGELSGCLNFQRSLTWLARGVGDETIRVTVRSLSEEVAIAIYNLAAASLQLCVLLRHLVHRDESGGTRIFVLKLHRFAQFSLQFLYEKRSREDPIREQRVALETTGDSAPPCVFDSEQLNLLCTATHAQFAEYQTLECDDDAAAQMIPMYEYIALAYDTCREVCESRGTSSGPSGGSKWRLGVIDGLTERVVAVKRHMARATSLRLFSDLIHDDETVPAVKKALVLQMLRAACLEQQKSVNKTKPLLDLSAERSTSKDPLSEARAEFEQYARETLRFHEVDTSVVELGYRPTAPYDAAAAQNVTTEMRGEQHGVKYPLGSEDAWNETQALESVRDFTLYTDSALARRDNRFVSAPSKIRRPGWAGDIEKLRFIYEAIGSVVFPERHCEPAPGAARSIVNALPENYACDEELDPILDILKRYYMLYSRLCYMESHIEKIVSEFGDDSRIHLVSCRNALGVFYALCTGVLFERQDMENRQLLEVGRLVLDHRHDDAMQRLQLFQWPLRPLGVRRMFSGYLFSSLDTIHSLFADRHVRSLS